MRLILSAAVLLGLLIPRPAHAGINTGLIQLAQGRTWCKAKRYSEGLKKLLQAAVTIQQADSSHAANRQWLPLARTCVRSWVNSVGRICRREGGVAQLEELRAIKKRVKYLSAPFAKRMLAVGAATCGRRIAALAVKKCRVAPSLDAIKKLTALERRLTELGLPKSVLGTVARGAGSCAYRNVQQAGKRCQREATVDSLRQLADGLALVGTAQRLRARGTYEACAKRLGKRAWSICQARRYVQGRRLLKEAIKRFGYFKARDRRFLAMMRTEWLPRCGSYHGTGWFNARLSYKKLGLKLSARLNLELSRTGKGDALIGELRVGYSGLRGAQTGCRILLTPNDGRYSLSGQVSGGVITLGLDPKMPQTKATEEVQIICGEQTPIVFKANLLHRYLVKAGGLALKLRPGAPKSVGHKGWLDRKTNGTASGRIVLKPLK